jgi:hypothetical protein
MSEVSALPGQAPQSPSEDISTLQKKRHFYLVTTRFCAVMIGASLGLAACTGVPIAKTNCWATAGSTVTTSTMGASPDAGIVSRGNTSSLDVIPCR